MRKRFAGLRNLLGRSVGVLAFTWRHPANRGRRIRAVARVLLFQVRGRITGARAIASVGRSSRIWADVRSYISARAMYGNPLDWNEMQAWRRVLTPGSLFVDVGANVGIYTIWAIDLGAEVVALEPSARAGDCLRENLALNGYGAEVVAAAVGSEPGTMVLTTDLDQQNHLVVDGSAPANGEVVEVTTLDSIIGDRVVQGLKIDVEGAELLVLQGATRALAERRIELIQLEWNDASVELLGQDREPVRELLARQGYSLYRPDELGELRPVEHPGFGPDVFARPT